MSLTRREFKSYEDYVRLQGRKARRHRDRLLANLPKDIVRFQAAFQAAKRFLRPGPVLCLGARTGAEVIGATRVGFTGSVGVDLHPVGRDVIQADWHALPFPDASYPNVYTNSLDHCLDLDRLAAEVHRVLVPNGAFYVMASDKPGPGKNAAYWLARGGNHEALFWDDADDLCAALAARRFAPGAKWRTGVWGHYVLTRAER